MEKKQIIQFYIENNILISPELIDDLNIPFPINTPFIVLNKDVLLITEHKIPINVNDYEKAFVLKEKNYNKRLYEKFKEYILLNIKKEDNIEQEENKNSFDINITNKQDSPISKEEDKNSLVIVEKNKEEFPEELSESNIDAYKEEYMKKHRIRVIFDYKEKNKKRTVMDFVGFFNSRFKELEKILRSRKELQNPTSISRILSKKEKDTVSIIGMVYDKSFSKNNNIILTIEDQTGLIKVVVTQSKEELFLLAQEIQLDEVIGVTGLYDGLIFANEIIIPDIPLTKELKKSPEEGYFVVITDPQIGNKLFLEEEFKKFLQWINGENEKYKDIVSKIKYLFIVGDLVEGVGIYPDQEYDLSIIDVKEQYKKLAEYLRNIKIPIIVCPGNHDVGRLSEPQPGFRDEYSKELWMLPNVIALSNPSMVNIFYSDNFEGFNVLLYHGGSFFYYFNNVQSIRKNGGATRSDLVMKYLLQRRHLAPSHTSTLYVPDSKKDPLIIDKVPDFFFSGHVHRSTVNNYRNITCINASCWVAKTEEQERRGLDPQPGRAFVVNMNNREVKILNFLSKESDDKISEDKNKYILG
ncbi:MAG: hypothetical protein KatS3mg002_0593 [Candidatus Woesearchaeota archaeon]|nr:MAG: hypothetical protein KatS3mg002_0593 [Candidatus Woesearchaeota archaeon]